jgi:katanin p60 ATPase-containing subunit A1
VQSVSSNGRPAAPSRGDSGLKRPVAGAAAAGAGGQGGGKAAAAVNKAEYSGPDGDLAANLERDMLDRSPGIRWVGTSQRMGGRNGL